METGPQNNLCGKSTWKLRQLFFRQVADASVGAFKASTETAVARALGPVSIRSGQHMLAGCSCFTSPTYAELFCFSMAKSATEVAANRGPPPYGKRKGGMVRVA